MSTLFNNVSDVTCCPVCQNKGQTLIYLNDYPVTEIYQQFAKNDFLGPVSFNQGLNYCSKCNHAFLKTLLPRDFIYNNYNTHSVTSIGSMQALDNFYKFVSINLREVPTAIVDIGANDTTLLKKYKLSGARLVGIDPNVLSDDPEIEILKDYVENIDFDEFASSKRLFLCSHTLEHIFEPVKFLSILSGKANTSDDFFFQFPSLDLLVRDGRFDQIHHQHINYFSLFSFAKLLKQCGFHLIAHQFDSDHYGALMCHFKKSEFIDANDTQGAIYSIGDILLSYESFKSATASADIRLSICSEGFACYGASLMLPILKYYVPSIAKANVILDSSKDKLGLSYVNFDIEICDTEKYNYIDADIVVTAISTKFATRKIVSRLIDLQTRNIILPYNTI